MRCARVSRPAILTLLALLAAASVLLAAVAYTIVLKDGSTLVAKEKYTVQNGKAIIILLNGTQTSMPVDQIDVKKTEQLNKLGLGNGVLIPGSPQDVGVVPAQPRKEETLGDLIHKQGAGPRDVPGSQRKKEQQPTTGRLLKTKAGFNDLATLPRRPYPHADVTSQLQQFFHSQGLEEVAIYEGTQSDRPLIEITAGSEGSVFNALKTASNGLLQIQTSFPNRMSAFELLFYTPSHDRAGQFVLTPEMAADLVSRKVDVAAFFVRHVQF
jgi:hypothetical protein